MHNKVDFPYFFILKITSVITLLSITISKIASEHNYIRIRTNKNNTVLAHNDKLPHIYTYIDNSANYQSICYG